MDWAQKLKRMEQKCNYSHAMHLKRKVVVLVLELVVILMLVMWMLMMMMMFRGRVNDYAHNLISLSMIIFMSRCGHSVC